MNGIEYTFLSELVAFPANYARLQGNFRSEFLQDATAREIFAAMVDLGNFDLLSLRDKLKGRVDFQLLLELNRDTVFAKPIMFDCYAMKLVEDWKARELAKIARAGAYTPELVSRAFEVEHFELFPKKPKTPRRSFWQMPSLPIRAGKTRGLSRPDCRVWTSLSAGLKRAS